MRSPTTTVNALPPTPGDNPRLADGVPGRFRQTSQTSQTCSISPYGNTLLVGLSSMNRLRVLYALEREELCVCELADRLGFSRPSVSQQLRRLLASRLVCARRTERKVYYSISDLTLNRLLRLALDAYRPV